MAAGFPCQPYSKAGLQKGEQDERHLWPELRRLTDEVRPPWLVGENVENAVRMVLDNILDDLEGINYKTQSFVVSAYCAGARFDGKRTFIVASPNDRSATVRRDSQLQSDAGFNAWGG
jgi:DNA (cytosine-5)-methyltransferase 1